LAGAYADSGTVRLTWGEPPPGVFRIRFRRPAWLEEDPAVSVNGSRVEVASAGGYLLVEREWKLGDVVSLTFPWRLALVESGKNGFNAPRLSRIDASRHLVADAVLVYGPSVLLMDRNNNRALGDGDDFALALYRTPDGSLALPAARLNIPRTGGAMVHAAS